MDTHLPGDSPPGARPSTGVPVLVRVLNAEIEDVVTIEQLPYTIGRSPGFGNDLVLRDGLVKRNHARIEKQGESYCIVDLESTNHTYVNGGIVELAVLHHGDVITIGRTSLVFMERLDREVLAQAVRRAVGYSDFRRSERPPFPD